MDIQKMIDNGEATFYGDGFLIWTGNTPRFITAEQAGN